MEQYKNLVREILNNGISKSDRTGTGTKSLFGHQMRFDLGDGFPLVTVKKTHWPSVVHELLWFLKGDTNVKYLQENGVKIWDDWADEKGDLGPVYGKQWVNWGGYDITSGEVKPGLNKGINQIQNVIDTLKTNPDSRRMIVSAWNVSDLSDMALEPCHAFFQFNTQPMSIWERGEWVKKNNMTEMFDDDEDDIDEMDRLNVPKYKLSLQLYQRSADIFLGVPFNIASYSLLLQMVSQCVNMIPNEFVWSGGDCHLYDNHEEQSGEMLSRKPKELPSVLLNPNVKDIFGFTFDDIELVNYNPHPLIRGKVAV